MDNAGHHSQRMLARKEFIPGLACGWCFGGWFKKAGLCSGLESVRK